MRTVYLPTKSLFIFLSFTFILFASCKKNCDDHSKTDQFPDEYIHYTVNGIYHSYEMPVDQVSANDSLENQTFNHPLFVIGLRVPNITTDISRIGYSDANIAVGSLQKLVLFASPQTEYYPYYATAASPIFITITEYGAVGQYIAGNFSGTITGNGPGNMQYNVGCSFRVKRRL